MALCIARVAADRVPLASPEGLDAVAQIVRDWLQGGASDVGASFGTAMLAADHADGFDGDSRDRAASWNPPRETVRPDPTVRGLYDELYGHYRELYESTATITHALAEVQRRG